MSTEKGRLLIVDDNEMIRDMLRQRLAKRGFEVSATGDARDLLNRVRKEQVELVLLDIEMPEVNGLNVLESLRANYSRAELPVIMVTANTQTEDMVQALDLGANDYVTKPINFPVALARIRTHLSLKQAEHALRESEQRYALAAQGANDGLWDWNVPDKSIYLSSRWKAIVGCQEDEIGTNPEEWFKRIHESDRERVAKEIQEHLLGRSHHFESEHRMLHRDGSYRWVRNRGLAIRDGAGEVQRMAGSLMDVTDRKVTDPLTSLPNRLLFLDRVGRLLARAKRRTNYLFAILFLDLDGFAAINDSLGHQEGDQLLVAVAARLMACVRETDTAAMIGEGITIARLGGGEFAILLDDLNSPSDAMRVAKRILLAFAAPFRAEKEVFISASGGIAMNCRDYACAEDLVRDAETAMHHAKLVGRGTCEIFDSEMRATITDRLHLEADLRRALNRQEFQNYYQPIVSLSSGRIVGFEALARWYHPTRGLLSPATFIPLAEETGVIHELGWRILCEASQQMSIWNKDMHPPISVSVNISAKQFVREDLIEHVESVVRDFGLAPGTLNLEITESTLLGDPAEILQIVSKIRALGILLSIDDFGTGYSSLSYLHQLPLDCLKIDRSFVDAMGTGRDGLAIVRAIVTMAKELQFRVVAEGIETAEQAALLKELGCDSGQGYYFSRPIRALEASRLIAKPSCLERGPR